MITRAHRFHGHGSLRFAYQKGKTVRGNYISLRFVRNNRRTTYRVAVVVSKKVHKSAVVRNRIRRRVYELVRVHLAPEQPYDLIFSVFDERIATMPAPELQRTILLQLHNAGLALLPDTSDMGGQSASRGIVDGKEK